MEKWEEIGLGSDLTKVRKKLESVEFEEGINILALQPGVGKTHKIKEYLKDKDKWLVTVPTYDLIESEYKDILEMEDVNYWKGFTRKCPKYPKNISNVKSLYKDIGLQPMVICGKACSPDYRKKCPYKKQFENSNKVITVSAFYNTPVFYENGKFKFDIAIVDEELSGYEEVKIDEEEINEAIQTIYEYAIYPEWIEEAELSVLPDFKEIIKNKKFYSPRNDYPIGDIIFSAIEDDKIFALKEIFLDNNWEDYKTVEGLDLLKLKKWLYYFYIYGEERYYGDPNIYRLFDLARQGIKVVFSDASFSELIFSELWKRYKKEEQKLSRKILFKKYIIKDEDYKEFKMSDKIKINLYKSDIKNEDFDVYRMWSTSNFHSGFINDEINDLIELLMRKYYSIGIISYMKEKARKFDFKNYGDFLYFGRLRGFNTFKENEIILVIGTPFANANDLMKDYNAVFVENVTESKKPNLKISGNDYLDFDNYQRYKLNSELYQAIHRIRPFEDSNKNIFVFGHVPNKIGEEFRLIKLNKGETMEFFEYYYRGVYPYNLGLLINNYGWSRPNLTSMDIAKEIRLYKPGKKTGFNSKLVTAIRNSNIKPITIQKIDKALKNGATTAEDIRKDCKNLKIDDEHLESFIHYAIDGDYIKFKNIKI